MNISFLTQAGHPAFYLYLGENTSFLYKRVGEDIQLVSQGSTRTPLQFCLPESQARPQLWIITNLSSETYEIQLLPTLKQREQKLLLQQKLQKLFAKQQYCTAISLTSSSLKFWQRPPQPAKQPYLLSSLMADELVQQWLDFLTAQQWMVLGVTTLALSLVTTLKKTLVLQQKACYCFRTPDDLLNLLYCHQGQLYFSRKIALPADNIQLTYELQRTIQFVTNQYPILQQDRPTQFDLYLLHPHAVAQITAPEQIHATLTTQVFSLPQFFSTVQYGKQTPQFATETQLVLKKKVFLQKKLYVGLIALSLGLAGINGGLFYTWQHLQAKQHLLQKKIVTQQSRFAAYQAALPTLPAGYDQQTMLRQAQLCAHIFILEQKQFHPFEMLYRFGQLFGQFNQQMRLKSLSWERPTSHTPKAQLRFTAERLAMAATLETETHAILTIMSAFEKTAKQIGFTVKTEKLPLDLHSRAELIQDNALDFNKLRKKRLFTVSLSNENH